MPLPCQRFSYFYHFNNGLNEGLTTNALQSWEMKPQEKDVGLPRYMYTCINLNYIIQVWMDQWDAPRWPHILKIIYYYYVRSVFQKQLPLAMIVVLWSLFVSVGKNSIMKITMFSIRIVANGYFIPFCIIFRHLVMDLMSNVQKRKIKNREGNWEYPNYKCLRKHFLNLKLNRFLIFFSL